MGKDLWYTVGGSILGSLIEESIEAIFPGVGELGFTGEIGGAIAGLLASNATKDEIRNSVQTFLKFAYLKVNQKTAHENISEEDIRLFSQKFKELPRSMKEQIIGNFKNMAPYEYGFIVDFLRELHGAQK